MARFYYLLDRGELVSPELTRQMKATLGDPGIRHKFVKGLESKPDTRIYRKSGTWRQFHSDSALVEGRRRRYILVGIAEDPRGGELAREDGRPSQRPRRSRPQRPRGPGPLNRCLPFDVVV